MSTEAIFSGNYNDMRSAIEFAADTFEEKELFNKLSKYSDEADSLAKELAEINCQIDDAARINGFDDKYLNALKRQKESISASLNNTEQEIHQCTESDTCKILLSKANTLKSIVGADSESEFVQEYKEAAQKLAELELQLDKNNLPETEAALSKVHKHISKLKKTTAYWKAEMECHRESYLHSCDIALKESKKSILEIYIDALDRRIDPERITAFELKRTLRAIRDKEYVYITRNFYTVCDFIILATYLDTIIACYHIRKTKDNSEAIKYTSMIQNDVKNMLSSCSLMPNGAVMYDDRVQLYDGILTDLIDNSRPISVLPFAAVFSIALAHDYSKDNYLPLKNILGQYNFTSEIDVIRLEALDALFYVGAPLIKNDNLEEVDSDSSVIDEEAEIRSAIKLEKKRRSLIVIKAVFVYLLLTVGFIGAWVGLALLDNYIGNNGFFVFLLYTASIVTFGISVFKYTRYICRMARSC